MEPETPTAMQQALLWTQIIFYATTTLIAVAAGVLGGIKYRLFRSGKPSVSINLKASSRPCSVDQIQIGVTAKFHNGSKVLAKARAGMGIPRAGNLRKRRYCNETRRVLQRRWRK